MMLLVAVAMTSFTPSGSPVTNFATFGNSQTKDLIKAWQPKPLEVPEGSCLTPSSTENMKRFVRARILLEDPSTGCVASFGDSLCVILCRFSRAEHQLILPLWMPPGADEDVRSVRRSHLQSLVQWHGKNFYKGAVLSGSNLEWPEDREDWSKAIAD